MGETAEKDSHDIKGQAESTGIKVPARLQDALPAPLSRRMHDSLREVQIFRPLAG